MPLYTAFHSFEAFCDFSLSIYTYHLNILSLFFNLIYIYTVIMRFFMSLAVAAMAAVASANNMANPFSIPTEGYTFKVGEPTALTWKPTTGGTVSLILQWGAVMTGNSGTVIACK